MGTYMVLFQPGMQQAEQRLASPHLPAKSCKRCSARLFADQAESHIGGSEKAAQPTFM